MSFSEQFRKTNYSVYRLIRRWELGFRPDISEDSIALLAWDLSHRIVFYATKNGGFCIWKSSPFEDGDDHDLEFDWNYDLAASRFEKLSNEHLYPDDEIQAAYDSNRGTVNGTDERIIRHMEMN